MVWAASVFKIRVAQARDVWGDIDWQHFSVLLAAALIGNPIGVLASTSMDPDALRVGTFICLAVLTVGLLFGHKVALPASTPMFFVAGVLLVGTKAFVGASVESFRRTTLFLLLAISIIGLVRVAL